MIAIHRDMQDGYPTAFDKAIQKTTPMLRRSRAFDGLSAEKLCDDIESAPLYNPCGKKPRGKPVAEKKGKGLPLKSPSANQTQKVAKKPKPAYQHTHHGSIHQC